MISHINMQVSSSSSNSNLYNSILSFVVWIQVFFLSTLLTPGLGWIKFNIIHVYRKENFSKSFQNSKAILVLCDEFKIGFVMTL